MAGEPRELCDDDRPVLTDAADRRKAVSLLLGSGLAAVAAVGASGAAGAAAAPAAAKAPPKAGDGLVFAAGERKGEPVTAADLTPDNPMVAAWPKDQGSGVVKDGSRLNRILVIRLAPGSLDEKTSARAAEGGIVAYSGFCTHAGCAIEQFKPDEQLIFCHCHMSQFDPRTGGRAAGGPARRSLPGLPVALGPDGKVIVAGEFVGKPGIAAG